MASSVIVKPGDLSQFIVNYEINVDSARKFALDALWKRFNRFDPATGQTHRIWYRPTNRKLEMNVEYLLPINSPAGRYRIETFVPGRHATTRQAIFTIANKFRNEAGVTRFDDSLAVVDMFTKYDVWVSLGEYYLEPSTNPLSGRVKQYDLSIEEPPEEISFGPVRWIPLFTEHPASTPRFDAPVGTEEERNSSFTENLHAYGVFPVWVGSWYDANPFLTWYRSGYHTGADLNLPGFSAADKDAPIYAVSDGRVTYAGYAGGWGNIIVIEHPDALVVRHDGSVGIQKIYSRYGHITDHILVAAGQDVVRGQKIGFIGLPPGYVTGWHLHFDISYTDKLLSRPAHWPDMSRIRALQEAGVSPGSSKFIEAQILVKNEVLAHYIDPLKFMRDNH